MAGKLCAIGVAPNLISAFSVVFAGIGAAGFVASGCGWVPWPLGWLAGAVGIQLRLICNLMDGMVAIEGGRKSVTGDLWNEIPDRLADTALFVGAGWAVGWPWVGALAGWAAVMTAYVRAMGASLTGLQDFCGPFAKPQRMATLTFAAVITAADPLWHGGGWIMKIALALAAAGTVATIVRRILRLAARLKEKNLKQPS